VKFYIHKLGCPKNDVDADYIAARLVAAGHSPAADPESADSVLVNTCGFIQEAKEESIAAILNLAALNKGNGARTLYATGCLTQRYGDEMLREMPELDGAFGHGALDTLAESVTLSRKHDRAVRRETRSLGYLTWKDRFISDGFPYSYLKISDGCDRGCTYCAIPLMRGRFRSRPLESIVREAEFLAANGKRELILVSQEATFWGYGLAGEPDIVDLLEALERVEGVDWIRLMYLHPAATSRRLIEYMAGDNRTLGYFDLPLQHANSDILKAMQRSIDREGIERLLADVRKLAPKATIRTTFIVGFPGETEKQFEELLDFTADHEFDRLGVFTYSAEDDTPAAAMSGQVPERVRYERMDRLMTLQREIAFRRNNSLIGKTFKVIIDTVNDGRPASGRTEGDCPDIDQEIRISGGPLRVGEIVPVRIDGVEGYDLAGTRVRE
jgi:ribosomal protein S12 methylthiotransferase